MGTERWGTVEFGDLLAAARRDDAAALGEMCERPRAYLTRLVATKLIPADLRDKADPEGIVQETLLAACRGFPQFRGDTLAQWHAYLCVIAERQVCNFQAYWGRKGRRHEQTLPSQRGSSSGFGLSQAADESSGPSSKADRCERDHLLLAVIERLQPDYRTVITLRIFEDLPFSDIATRMGRSNEAVRKLWTRAHQSLREAVLSDDRLRRAFGGEL